MRPVISFIVPVYGVEAYLRECLDSIEGQTFRDWEAILVDDGSPDASGAICDEYAEKDLRFRVIHKENGGVSAARNDGIDAATGEWAYFVDSDDYLELDAAERLLAAAAAHDADCVMSYCEKFYENGNRSRSAQFSEAFVTEDRSEIEAVQKYVLYQKYGPHYTSEVTVGYAAPWGKFTRMSVIKDNGVRFDPYLKGVFDDGLFSLYLLEHVNCLAYIHEKTYNYRVVGSSLTHSFKPNAMEVQERGYERIEQFLKETHKGVSFWQAYYAHVVRFFGGYLTKFFFNPENPSSKDEVEQEIRAKLSSEPYSRAVENIDWSMLVPKDKYLALCEQRAFVPGLRAYSMLRTGIKGWL